MTAVPSVTINKKGKKHKHTVEVCKGAFTFQSATHGFQHFSYFVSATNVVDRMFVTIFLVLDLHS